MYYTVLVESLIFHWHFFQQEQAAVFCDKLLKTHCILPDQHNVAAAAVAADPLSPTDSGCHRHNDFNWPSVCDENKSPRLPALPTETSGNFPPENSLRPPEWQSQTASCLLMVIMYNCVI